MVVPLYAIQARKRRNEGKVAVTGDLFDASATGVYAELDTLKGR